MERAPKHRICGVPKLCCLEVPLDASMDDLTVTEEPPHCANLPFA